MTANFLSVALIAVQAAVTPAPAAEMRTPDGTSIVTAAADCSGAAAQVVSQTGGQLLSAASRNQGGQTVCVITVLVPGNGSERPKKVTVSVPQ